MSIAWIGVLLALGGAFVASIVTATRKPLWLASVPSRVYVKRDGRWLCYSRDESGDTPPEN